ncbi:MAG: bleomycin resistance protein [Symbiobacteriaceae bacterium]|nr:bleomycin resistance protein [Symbiobacteriaceae bacterium]
MKSFYAGTLQMPVIEESADSFTVQIGASTLSYRRSDSPAFYHLAFLLAPGAFEEMKVRLTAAPGLMADTEGTVLFTSDQWTANHFYFEDPDRNILEILGTTAGETGAAPWARIGEVGLPVPNLAGFVSQIGHLVSTELPPESETFQFYGDDHGVLVLVREGRPWFPTDRRATAHDIGVVFEGSEEGVVQVGPVTLRSVLTA